MRTDSSLPDAAIAHNDHGQRALETVKHSITLYGALSVVLLLTVIVVSSQGHTASTFMWVRACLLPAMAVVLHRQTGAAAHGSRRAFSRVSTLAVILPIAIIGVDVIPGVCPPWYAVMQTACMLPVIRAAFISRKGALRAAFA